MKKITAILTALLLAVSFSGCARKGPILVDFGYEAPTGAQEETSKVVVGIAPFKDDRGKTDSVAGKRFNSLNDQSNELVVQGRVSDKVTAGVKKAFEGRNIAVKNVPAWDLTEAGIAASGANLLIGGEIKTLWVESASTLASTKATAKVELRVIAADAADKKIIRALNVNSLIERQNVSFSAAFVQSVVTEAVSAAVNQLFNDEELKKRLK